MLNYKKDMTDKERSKFEEELKNEYLEHKGETEKDLSFRLSGVSATRGSSGKQFVGYTTLGEFYRGDQWSKTSHRELRKEQIIIVPLSLTHFHLYYLMPQLKLTAQLKTKQTNCLN